MKCGVFVLGYGRAGGRVADAFVEQAKKTGQNFVVRALAINTARSVSRMKRAPILTIQDPKKLI